MMPDAAEILGTGFFVTTCGTMFTAGHVARQWGSDSEIIVIHQEFNGTGYVCRRIVRALVHPVTDVAILSLESWTSPATQTRLRNAILEISVEAPPKSSQVTCWGFPQSHLVPPGPHYDGYTILLERGGALGVVQEHFPNGRDRVMQPGECFETSMDTMGGASGGPVFNEQGKVFAVVSSGLDESTTYVAPVKDLALARIFRAEPPGGDGSMLNLLEYFERY
ncbi:MAG TPA: serine protease [Casimicrobiaceae bacterium]